MIFAAGLGTRLKPLTDNLPKALAPVAGHTLLYYVLMRLRAAGCDEFVINIHHFADKIREYVATDPELSQLDIRYSDETDLLRDTGGGIRYAESLLRSAEGRFLVHNVDIISDLQLDWFLSQARPGALATLLLSERVTKRYFLCDGDNRIVGWTNVATGEVKTPFIKPLLQACIWFPMPFLTCSGTLTRLLPTTRSTMPRETGLPSQKSLWANASLSSMLT